MSSLKALSTVGTTVIEKAQNTVDVPQIPYIDTIVDVPGGVATPGANHPDSTKDEGGFSESIFSSSGRRARCDAAPDANDPKDAKNGRDPKCGSFTELLRYRPAPVQV